MILRILKYFLFATGGLFTILTILCFTSASFWTWYKYSTKYSGIHRPPDEIVILGGGGMPSETGLMRCWYGAKAANYFYRANIIVALPGDTTDSLSSVCQMRDELVVRGIAKSRVSFEPFGTNTRAQAMNLASRPSASCQVSSIKCKVQSVKTSILIITSPEHLYRAVLTFRKAGFRRVDGMPAFEAAIESGLAFDDRLLGGRRWMPGIGNNLTVRYEFWTQLHYEELVIREWMAVVYYKLKGWI